MKDNTQQPVTFTTQTEESKLAKNLERATNALRANAVYSIFGLISFPILRNAEMPGSYYDYIS